MKLEILNSLIVKKCIVHLSRLVSVLKPPNCNIWAMTAIKILNLNIIEYKWSEEVGICYRIPTSVHSNVHL